MKIRKMKVAVLGMFLSGMCFLFTSCGESKSAVPAGDTAVKTDNSNNAAVTPTDPMQNKGIGPVQSLDLAAIDDAMAKEGETLFSGKCSACHKMDEKYVGPALTGVTKRRTPEWVMNMILNPQEMTEKDPIAKDLLAQFLSPMANQSLSQDEARKILEFFRSNDSK